LAELKMKDRYLPVFSVDWHGLLKKLVDLEGEYGILAPVHANNTLLYRIRDLGKPFLIDSGVFVDKANPWYNDIYCEFNQERWIREARLASESHLREKISQYLNRCDRFSPDYVFAPDIINEPILSLYLARLSWEEYWLKPRSYSLIGVVQVGNALNHWQQESVPWQDALPLHYSSPKSFLAPLISEYRNIGYEYIALGGLLKPDYKKRTGLRFSLSIQELDELLTWSRPDFVLAGLALTRLEVLKKHQVWADSTGWLWWDARYDYQRFANWNALQEVANYRLNSPIDKNLMG
jgi:hypothetical protein